ncbi:MAG: hypothetical protein RL219_1183 [Actinomycetota bacterium]
MRVTVPGRVEHLAPWVESGVLGVGDVHFAEWVARTFPECDEQLLLAAALCSWATQRGHACISLSGIPAAVRREVTAGRDDGAASDALDSLVWPEPGEWLAAVRRASEQSGNTPAAVRLVERWGTDALLDDHPLVLHDDRLYLQRHWADECTVSALFRTRAADTGHTLSSAALALLDRLLPSAEPDGSPNQQRRAGELVVAKRLAVIAGGPGTGKTYSVARLLAVLIADALDRGTTPRIALAAPTGKAKARLSETIAAALAPRQGEAPLDPPIVEALRAVVPTTIHGLLGSFGIEHHRFRHDAANPLPHDIVVVDETSMVSLPLLTRLAEAVRPEARLVLIGDPDQLESVELGAVLADLVRAGERPGSALAGHLVRLLRVHRFEHDSPIAVLADAIRAGDDNTAIGRLALGEAGDLHGDDGAMTSSVRFVVADDPRHASSEVERVIRPLIEAAAAAARAGDALGALSASTRARVLCAHRLGPWGVSEWNERGEHWLRGARAGSNVWYVGRPLLVTKNDPRLGLANGDTGVVVEREGRLVAVFAGPTAGSTLEFDPVQLESVETAYAMTVHKSQGSEYPSVVLIAPPATSPLVGRELVYTAITRAKSHVLVVGSEDAIRRCITTPARRMTGLAESFSG